MPSKSAANVELRHLNFDILDALGAPRVVPWTGPASVPCGTHGYTSGSSRHVGGCVQVPKAFEGEGPEGLGRRLAEHFMFPRRSN